MKTTLVWIAAFFAFIIMCIYSSETASTKDKQFKVDMANTGLEQCVNPYASKNSSQQVIWVRTCPEHLK